MENSGQSSCTAGAAVDGAEFMLFGVRVRVDPMRKSVSLNDLSQYEVIPQPEPTDAGDGNGGGGEGSYASADDAAQRQSSGGGRERKRGVPWTEEEHKLFLLGLQKVGKGDWRGISRNFVKTRTPTQVASHAQKYFLRRSNINRRRRRSSLFDITTDSVTAIPMEEKAHQKQNFQPLVSPTQIPLPETSIINGPQAFPVTMCPVSLPIQIDNPMERFTFGNLGQTNLTEFVHQIPVNPLPSQTRMVDLNLNQRLPEDLSPLSLNLSLSLDQVQDQFSRHSTFETLSRFSNGDSMISVV